MIRNKLINNRANDALVVLEQASTSKLFPMLLKTLKQLSKVCYTSHNSTPIVDILREYNILTFIDNCLQYVLGYIEENDMYDFYCEYQQYDKKFWDSGIYAPIFQYYYKGQFHSSINCTSNHHSIRYCRMLEMK